MRVPKAQCLGHEKNLTCGIARHLLAEDTGKVRTTEVLNCFIYPLRKNPVEIVRTNTKMMNCLTVSGGITKSKRHKCLFFRDQAFFSSLGCPGKADSGGHYVEPNFFYSIDNAKDRKAVCNAQHGANCKYRFMIIGNLEVEIPVFLGKSFPYVPYMDASNGTARAGMVAE